MQGVLLYMELQVQCTVCLVHVTCSVVDGLAGFQSSALQGDGVNLTKKLPSHAGKHTLASAVIGIPTTALHVHPHCKHVHSFIFLLRRERFNGQISRIAQR